MGTLYHCIHRNRAARLNELTSGPEDLPSIGGTLCLRGRGRGVVAQLEAAPHSEPLGPELVALHRLHTLQCFGKWRKMLSSSA